MKRDTNGHDHAFDIAQNIGVLKAHYAISCLIQESVAINVLFRSDVVGMAVKLDNQAMLPAQEIGKERTDGHLPTEFCAELGA